MGLYLARQVAEALAIDLQAASQVGGGERVHPHLPRPGEPYKIVRKGPARSIPLGPSFAVS